MNTEQNKAVVLRFNKEGIEGKNIKIMDELFQSDFINRTVRPGFSPEPDGMVAFLKIMWSALSDIKVEIYDQIAEGNKVTTRKSIFGMHSGVFMNVPATGKRIEFKVIDMVRVAEGKYAEHWNVIDMQSVLMQMKEN